MRRICTYKLYIYSQYILFTHKHTPHSSTRSVCVWDVGARTTRIFSPPENIQFERRNGGRVWRSTHVAEYTPIVYRHQAHTNTLTQRTQIHFLSFSSRRLSPVWVTFTSAKAPARFPLHSIRQGDEGSDAQCECYCLLFVFYIHGIQHTRSRDWNGTYAIYMNDTRVCACARWVEARLDSYWSWPTERAAAAALRRPQVHINVREKQTSASIMFCHASRIVRVNRKKKKTKNQRKNIFCRRMENFSIIMCHLSYSLSLCLLPCT